MAVVAKCTHCLFELEYKTVEQDLNNDCKWPFLNPWVGINI